MNTLNPPIALEHPENQYRVDYIQDEASKTDFDYPPVSSCWRSKAYYVLWILLLLCITVSSFSGILRAHGSIVEGFRSTSMFRKSE